MNYGILGNKRLKHVNGLLMHQHNQQINPVILCDKINVFLLNQYKSWTNLDNSILFQLPMDDQLGEFFHFRQFLPKTLVHHKILARSAAMNNMNLFLRFFKKKNILYFDA